jgi:imidazolonepropionase-like amidohydrolase
MLKRLLLLMLLMSFQFVQAQVTFPTNGVEDKRPQLYAFINATIHIDYATVIENAVMIVQNDKIVGVGADLAIPKGAIVSDLSGKHMYPSFVELSSNIGIPKDKTSYDRGPVMSPKITGAFNANDAIKANFDAVASFKVDDAAAEKLRKVGFGVALTHSKDGLVRGTGSLVSLRNAKENEVILKEQASAHFSFDKGSSRMDNPSSLMGAIALIRQTNLNANWYRNQEEIIDLTLQSFNDNRRLPQFFEAGTDKLFLLRADRLGDEMGIQYIIMGAGDEYQRIEEVKATGAALIIPVNFPKAYDVEDPFDAINVEYADMKHWELAPSNLKRLSDAGINFSVTTDELKDVSKFLEMLEKTVEAGVSEEALLKALTYTPAILLNQQNLIGSLKGGMLANFLVTDGSPFVKDAVIYENWIQGEKHELKSMDMKDYSGDYLLLVDGKEFNLQAKSVKGKTSFEIIVNDSTKWKVNANIDKQLVNLSFSPEDDSFDGKLRLTGWTTVAGFAGNGELANGKWVEWNANRKGDSVETDVKKEKDENEEEEDIEEAKIAPLGGIVFPFVAFGNDVKPISSDILIKNATVWTNEETGILTDTDVLLQNGKITKIGQNLSASGATVIEGKGMHLTAGIVDEHSHIGISSGVNEGSESVTAEVNIEDVVDSEDINIYRQLAGGTTTSQLLHGSANAIGGRSAIVKLKWGYSPEEMKIKGADKFIKFALGENIKQSNWGDMNDVRFPQTRMGAEQVFVDAFNRARAYEAEWKNYNSLAKKEKAKANAPRKDMELETLVEILNAKRFITCHSYVQSEINMLMKVAEQYGFKINTFTHILEGYKLADKMKDHGVGGSTFSDWWAYKFEVNDAIPYNAALMSGEGVVTAINSDDAEMGRRLNQEAAKTIKYGGVEEQEALKMVTLNPAKLLHLEDRIGSIREGKDADVVLWTAHPLSVYAKSSKTIIDGIIFYDADEQDAKLAAVKKERARLIAKMQGDKKKGEETQLAKPKTNIIYHCETIIENYSSLK